MSRQHFFKFIYYISFYFFFNGNFFFEKFYFSFTYAKFDLVSQKCYNNKINKNIIELKNVWVKKN